MTILFINSLLVSSTRSVVFNVFPKALSKLYILTHNPLSERFFCGLRIKYLFDTNSTVTEILRALITFVAIHVDWSSVWLLTRWNSREGITVLRVQRFRILIKLLCNMDDRKMATSCFSYCVAGTRNWSPQKIYNWKTTPKKVNVPINFQTPDTCQNNRSWCNKLMWTSTKKYLTVTISTLNSSWTFPLLKLYRS